MTSEIKKSFPSPWREWAFLRWRLLELLWATLLGVGAGGLMTWVTRDWATRLTRPGLDPAPELLAIASFLTGVIFILALKLGVEGVDWLERRSARRRFAAKAAGAAGDAGTGSAVNPAGEAPAAESE